MLFKSKLLVITLAASFVLAGCGGMGKKEEGGGGKEDPAKEAAEQAEKKAKQAAKEEAEKKKNEDKAVAELKKKMDEAMNKVQELNAAPDGFQAAPGIVANPIVNDAAGMLVARQAPAKTSFQPAIGARPGFDAVAGSARGAGTLRAISSTKAHEI